MSLRSITSFSFISLGHASLKYVSGSIPKFSNISYDEFHIMMQDLVPLYPTSFTSSKMSLYESNKIYSLFFVLHHT
jgi:hypothetical protein